MGINLQDLLRQLGTTTMPGNSGQATYDQSQFYPMQPTTAPTGAEAVGNALGNFFGGIANQRMASRNSQEQMLEKAWEVAQSQGPQAAIDFLNNPNLPSWFKSQVLAGITPATFQAKLTEQQRGIYDNVRNAVTKLLQEAKDMSPEQADQYIQAGLKRLLEEYASSGVNANAFSIPKDVNGHYVNPFSAAGGKADYASAQQMAEQINTQAATMANTDPAAAQAWLDKQRALFAKQFPQFATLINQQPHPTNPSVGSDIRAQGLSPTMKVSEYLTKMGFPSRVKVLSDLKLDEILDAPISEYWNATQHMLDFSQIQREIDSARSREISMDRVLHTGNAKNDPIVIRLQTEFAHWNSEYSRLRSEKYGNMGLNYQAMTPAEKTALDKALKEAEDKRNAIQQQIDQRLQELELGGGGGVGAGGPGTPPTPPTPTPPVVPPVVGQFKALLAGAGVNKQARLEVLKQLRTPSWVQGMASNPALAKLILDNLGLSVEERKFMETGQEPKYPQGAPPAPKPATNMDSFLQWLGHIKLGQPSPTDPWNQQP